MEDFKDLAAERFVLAGTAKSSDAFLDVDYLLTAETFTDETNQIIWKCIKSLRDEKIDIIIDLPLIRSKAKDLNLHHIVEEPKELEYISNLLFFNVEISNIRKYAAKIKKEHVKRLLYQQFDLMKNDLTKLDGSESIDTILSLAENRLFDFSNLLVDSGNEGISHISEGAEEYLEYLLNNEKDIAGLSTGFPIWDSLLGGCRRKAVNIIGARTGIGKSMLADNIALHVAGNLNIPVLYLDTEMSKDGHWKRMWSRLAEVSSIEIENGKFGRNEIKNRKVREAVKKLNSIPYYYVNIAGKAFEETLAYVRRWLIKEVGYNENGVLNDCLIIYDYLKMMSGAGISSEMKEFQILGFQMTGLHNFAVKFDVPILSFVQLNRDGINKESTDTVSQSDRITWLASSLTIYKPKGVEELADTINEGNMKMIVVKNRYGAVNRAEEYINIHADGSIAKIVEGRISSDVPPPNKKKKEKDKEEIGFEHNEKRKKSKNNN